MAGEETEAPLLEAGKIALPAGAICCTADSYRTRSQVILPERWKYLAEFRGVLQNKIA